MISRRKLFALASAAAVAPALPPEEFSTDNLIVRCTERMLPMQYMCSPGAWAVSLNHAITREAIEDNLYKA